MTFLQNSRRRPHNHTSPFAGHASELSGFTCGVDRRFSDNNRQLLPTILEIENIGACDVNAVASYGVPVMRIGAVFFPSAPFGTRITVYSLTPSRIGIITSMATRTLAKPALSNYGPTFSTPAFPGGSWTDFSSILRRRRQSSSSGTGGVVRFPTSTARAAAHDRTQDVRRRPN